MSEKINQLWKIAKEYIDIKYDHLTDKTDKYLEKFVELIISDCSDLSNNEFYFKKTIRQHFGLKQ